MRKILIALALLSSFSCSVYQGKIQESFMVETTGTVVSIDGKSNSFKVHWECTNPPFKYQPCVRMSVHSLDAFDGVKVGDSFSIKKN